jgi:chorismate mutase
MRGEPSDPGPSLDALRLEIDRLDRALLEQLAARRDVVAELGAWKRAHGVPGHDPTREAELHARWAEHARALALPEPLAHAILEAILSHSRTWVG